MSLTSSRSPGSIYKTVTWLAIFGLYFLSAAALMAAWYAWAARSSRNRAFQVLRWIENALTGHGHVTGLRWLSTEEFEVPVRLLTKVFHRTSILVRISRRDLPFFWLLTRFKNSEPDTLTFRADLDLKPNFALDMQSMRWFARSHKNLDPTSPGWQFQSSEPLVLTTRMDWQRETAVAIHSVLNSELSQKMQLKFRRTSPHFCVTMPLECASTEAGSESHLFHMLRSIAEGVSTKAS